MVRSQLRSVLVGALLTLAALALGQNTPPKVVLSLDAQQARAGALIGGRVVVEMAPGMHVYQNPPSEEFMIPIEVKAASPATILVGKPRYPKGNLKKVGGAEKPVAVHSGRFEIPVRFRLPSRPGRIELAIEFAYQQCSEDNCFPPAKITAKAPVRVIAAGQRPTMILTQGLAQDATPASPAPQATDQQPKRDTDTGLAGFLVRSYQGGDYLILILALVVVGLAINLTPCVYPMIPVTISFFSGQAGGSRSGRVGLGVVYMLGIAVTYGIVGGVAAGAGAAFGDLFTKPLFNYGLAALMFGLALSMFGVYEIGIPPALARQLKGRSGPVGALMMGLLVGVAAAPCAGPAIAAIFAEVAKTRSVPLGILLFTAIGLGIGLPYVFLAAAATGAKGLPKAGAWMVTVKSLLGLVVVAVGVNYLIQAIGPGLGPQGATAVWIAFCLLGAFYLLFLEKGGTARAAVAMKGVAVLILGAWGGMLYQAQIERGRIAEIERLAKGAGVTAAVPTKIDWTPFSEEAWARAKTSGKVVVVDATANWCAECKVIDKEVFAKPEVIVAMQNAVPIKVDWSTGVEGSFQDRTAELFGIVGLPHIVVFRPDGSQHRVFTKAMSPEEFLAAIREAASA
jgi:thiol:disulfide interchange protein DsbD